jgi:hypothetical protein
MHSGSEGFEHMSNRIAVRCSISKLPHNSGFISYSTGARFHSGGRIRLCRTLGLSVCTEITKYGYYDQWRAYRVRHAISIEVTER